MYHPYFRGKQNELIAIREKAGLLASRDFVPIIEPVKESLGNLERTLKAICEADGRAIVIINPYHGDHSEDGVNISELLRNGFSDHQSRIAVGILLKKDMPIGQVFNLYSEHEHENTTFIHAGFTDAKGLAERLGGALRRTRNVFFEAHCGRLYRKHFQGSNRILLRDGFIRRRNADQPRLELFSDLHVTFQEEGMDGFGDFLIVGDDYTESGGPAYAVAIHLTFIDPDQDDVMFIYHFVSTTRDTPTDPAGKFAEALNKLMNVLASGNSKLFESSAITEFRELHAAGHFPGLGYVKRLSMKHHIETLVDYFK
ncbi:sce7725 family protein [Bradyrhizobium sp. ERR14]|uniref:sce7725 family protein n=1 Tax=Bradyrhizobium sp. ERR14 TaxID=2663837 RepID=UPI0016114A3E|nr:sce7725 family protein [Bradyrhizobium sp. ERR14]MBB4397013.1 hypothetical protein [Bradyrhizobium sp. ERR14]